MDGFGQITNVYDDAVRMQTRYVQRDRWPGSYWSTTLSWLAAGDRRRAGSGRYSTRGKAWWVIYGQLNGAARVNSPGTVLPACLSRLGDTGHEDPKMAAGSSSTRKGLSLAVATLVLTDILLAQSLQTLIHQPPAGVGMSFLLTDGTVMFQVNFPDHAGVGSFWAGVRRRTQRARASA